MVTGMHPKIAEVITLAKERQADAETLQEWAIIFADDLRARFTLPELADLAEQADAMDNTDEARAVRQAVRLAGWYTARDIVDREPDEQLPVLLSHRVMLPRDAGQHMQRWLGDAAEDRLERCYPSGATLITQWRAEHPDADEADADHYRGLVWWAAVTVGRL